MPYVWENTTSYSRGELDRTPQAYTLRLPGLRIIVHRHKDYPRETWLLSCPELAIDCRPLVSDGAEAAQREALQRLVEHLTTLLGRVTASAEARAVS